MLPVILEDSNGKEMWSNLLWVNNYLSVYSGRYFFAYLGPHKTMKNVLIANEEGGLIVEREESRIGG